MTFLYPLKFVLALCSIVYELLLAQGLSAFMEDTVLRYSITIGLYMFSLGVGAMLIEGRLARDPVVTLGCVEIALTIAGGASVAALYALDIMNAHRVALGCAGHALIILIGVLTGMELPLLVSMRNREKSGDENRMIAADYAGALTGTLLFAFVFYARIGLIPTAFLIGFLNAAAGVALYTQRDKVSAQGRARFNAMIVAQAVLCAAIAVCLIHAGAISEYFIRHYTAP